MKLRPDVVFLELVPILLLKAALDGGLDNSQLLDNLLHRDFSFHLEIASIEETVFRGLRAARYSALLR